MSDSRVKQDSSKFKLIFTLILIVVVFSGLFVFSYSWQSNSLNEQLVIEGNTIISSNEFEKIIGDSLKTRSEALFEIKQKVKEHPFVKSAYVTHKNAEYIGVEIDEKIPIAITIDEEGNLGYIDNNGEYLPFRNFPKYSNLPILRGLFNYSAVDTAALIGFLTILGDLYDRNDVKLHQNVSEIVYNKYLKSFKIIFSDPYSIYEMGSIQSITEKMNNLSTIADSKYRNIELFSYDYIDLRWENPILYKKDSIY
jgi:hypothetical protein